MAALPLIHHGASRTRRSPEENGIDLNDVIEDRRRKVLLQTSAAKCIWAWNDNDEDGVRDQDETGEENSDAVF